MKILDARCPKCGHVQEVLVDNTAKFGESAGPCEQCGDANVVTVPVAPSVRTPLNSVSFVDGSCDHARKQNFALEREACKLDEKALQHRPGSTERELVKAEAEKVRAGIKAEKVL